MKTLALPVGAFSLLLVGCGIKGQVSLSARLDAASVEVSPGPLGATLNGGFDLTLDLGDHAPNPTSVSLGGFSLKQDQTTLVESLSLSSSEAFPVDVGVGESTTVVLTLDGSQFVDSAVGDQICAGEVWIAGTVTDTLSEGKPTPLATARFAPACPGP